MKRIQNENKHSHLHYAFALLGRLLPTPDLLFQSQQWKHQNNV